jgi:uncharacterized protein (DUF1778 family)
MSCFQVLTTAVPDAELALLRERFSLEPHQKAELLREMAAIAGWVAHQATQGHTIEARRGEEVERLVHPALERLRNPAERSLGDRRVLTDAEVQPLAAVLDQGFDPPPALRAALANLAQAQRYEAG